MEHRRLLSSQTYGFSFASAKPTRWKYLKIPIAFSTVTFSLIRYGYCYYRVELPISWHSKPRDCLELYFEPYRWNESDFALGWEIITFYQNQDTWHLHKCWWVKKKWLLHLGNLAQTSKTFPNIISKITQHNQLLAKHKIIDLLMVRVTLNEYTSNFESLDWDKYHVPDAFFEIVSLFFYYSFFPEFLLFLAVETKQECKCCKEKLVHGKTPTIDWEVWNFKIYTTCSWSKIQIQLKDSLGLEKLRGSHNSNSI